MIKKIDVTIYQSTAYLPWSLGRETILRQPLDESTNDR